MSEMFTLVDDATYLVAKGTLWEERDKVLQQIEKLNNEVLPKVAVNPQPRIG